MGKICENWREKIVFQKSTYQPRSCHITNNNLIFARLLLDIQDIMAGKVSCFLRYFCTRRWSWSAWIQDLRRINVLSAALT